MHYNVYMYVQVPRVQRPLRDASDSVDPLLRNVREELIQTEARRQQRHRERDFRVPGLGIATCRVIQVCIYKLPFVDGSRIIILFEHKIVHV